MLLFGADTSTTTKRGQQNSSQGNPIVESNFKQNKEEQGKKY